MPTNGQGYDMMCLENWSTYIFNNGLSKIYFSGTDYPPLYHYILWIFSNIQGSIESIHNNLYLLKGITLVFDFIAGFILIKFLSEKYTDKNQIFIMSFFYFLNFFVLYNTIIWGQVDGIMTCFIFISFYFAYRNKILISILFYL